MMLCAFFHHHADADSAERGCGCRRARRFPGNGLSLCAFRSRLQFCDYLVDRIFGLVDLALIE
jgi:hypothetical protein